MTHEILPGIFEVNDICNTFDTLMKANDSIDYFTLKSRLKSNNILGVDKKSCFNTILAVTPPHVYKLIFDYSIQTEVIIK